MKKLGAFGCSYTNYRGVTYADLLSSEFDLYTNGGQGGAGNRLVFNRAVEYLSSNEFSEEDLTIIQWSSLTRFDYYSNGHPHFEKNSWVSGGTVFHNEDISLEFRLKYFNMFLQIRELVNYIDSIVAISKVKSARIIMTYMLEPWFAHFFGEPSEDNNTTFEWRRQVKKYQPFIKLQELYSTPLFISPSIEQIALDNPKDQETLYTPHYENELPEPVVDYHPSAFQHLIYAEMIAKHVGIKLDTGNLKSVAHIVNELQITPYGDKKLMHDVGVDLGFENLVKPNTYFDKY